MSAKYPVYYFDSNMFGAPELSGTAVAGQLIALLDAVLLNGFGQKTLTSLSVSGTTATGVVGSGSPFKVGDIVRIDGANESALNAHWRVEAITATSFSFTVPSGTPSGTGVITARYAPQGDWEKAASCPLNHGLYRSTKTDGSECGIHINDSGSGVPTPAAFSGANSATMCSFWHKRRTPFTYGDEGFEYATNLGNQSWVRFSKSSGNSANQKAWFVVCDGYSVYMGVKLDGGASLAGGITEASHFNLHFFGDTVKVKTNDIFNFLVVGGAPNGVNSATWMYNPTTDSHAVWSSAHVPFWLPQNNVKATGILSDPLTAGSYFFRSWTGSAGVSIAQRHGVNCLGGQAGSLAWWAAIGLDGKRGPTYPNPANNGFIGQPCLVTGTFAGSQFSIMGVLPGFISPLVAIPVSGPVSNSRLMAVDYGSALRDLAIMQLSMFYSNASTDLSYPHVAFDLTGPWR